MNGNKASLSESVLITNNVDDFKDIDQGVMIEEINPTIQ